jgi:hypothetical protein
MNVATGLIIAIVVLFNSCKSRGENSGLQGTEFTGTECQGFPKPDRYVGCQFNKLTSETCKLASLIRGCVLRGSTCQGSRKSIEDDMALSLVYLGGLLEQAKALKLICLYTGEVKSAVLGAAGLVNSNPFESYNLPASTDKLVDVLSKRTSETANSIKGL